MLAPMFCVISCGVSFDAGDTEPARTADGGSAGGGDGGTGGSTDGGRGGDENAQGGHGGDALIGGAGGQPATCAAAGGTEGPDGACYVLRTDALDWAGAVNACSAIAPGFHLAVVTSEEEMTWIDTFIAPTIAVNERVWLGASDRTAEGTWVWENGEPWAFTAWLDGQPNDNGDEDCLEIHVLDVDMWNDRDCAVSHAYLCER